MIPSAFSFVITKNCMIEEPNHLQHYFCVLQVNSYHLSIFLKYLVSSDDHIKLALHFGCNLSSSVSLKNTIHTQKHVARGLFTLLKPTKLKNDLLVHPLL